MTLFSVVIPTYNRQLFLDEAVKSVLQQTIQDFECIVVDDNSPNPARVPSDDQRVRVVRRHATGGPAAARNTGITEARGKQIAFLDDDDLYTPNRLSLALEGLERAPVTICLSKWLGEESVSGKPAILMGKVRDWILDYGTPPPGCVTVPKDSLVLFDETYKACEDLEWLLRLTEKFAVWTIPEVGYLVRKHSGERTLHGTSARIAGSQQLLSQYEEYFSTHRRARAFRMYRIGMLENKVGNASAAFTWFMRSFMILPRPRVMVWLARSLQRRIS